MRLDNYLQKIQEKKVGEVDETCLDETRSKQSKITEGEKEPIFDERIEELLSQS